MHNRTDKIRAAIVVALTLSTLGVYALYRPATAPHKARAEGRYQPSAQRAADAPTKPAPAPVAAKNADVTLSAALDRGSVLKGSDGLVHVALTLRAEPGAGVAETQPTDALVVLDISGSMNGQKLEYAKQALHQLIGRLGPRDRFGLVTYESDAQLVVPLSDANGESVARFHRQVDELETAGGTNMSAGLDLALAQLRRRERSGASVRVLLLSDGHANEGDSSPEGLAARVRRVTQQDHVLSSLGIGDDFNEDLMTRLAEIGTGNFYYLSRVEMLGGFFDAELKAAGQTVASALELQFAPAQGVELVELSGYPIEHQGRQASVRPGNLMAGQERVLWATLRAPTDALRDVELGSFKLHFKRDEAAYVLEGKALPALACVTDHARYEASIVKPVWEQYTVTELYQKSKSAIGRAIAEGDAEDLERERSNYYRENAMLANKLGSARVLDKLDEMAREVDQARLKQAESPSRRAYYSKQAKSRALFERRRDAYNSDPLLGL